MVVPNTVPLLLTLLALTTNIPTSQGLEGRCGDCWCISGTNGTCPTDTTGITDSFTSDDQVYSTFVLSNPDASFLTLQTSDGATPCFPFADALGAPIDGYDLSNEPQCAIPVSTNETVCAYVYDPASPSCEGRSYEIVTYSTEEEATTAGASIVHKGACGVCSTAQDFGARIATYGELESNTVVCATKYFLSKDFDGLVSCFTDMGFTESCATLWAHFAATNAAKCATACLPDSSGLTPLQGSAPECAPLDCLTCKEPFSGDFEDIGGFTPTRAGITERIAYDCEDFYHVTHDPCVAAGPATPTISPAPVAAPSPSAPAPTSGAATEAPVAAPSSARSRATVASVAIVMGTLMATRGMLANLE